MDFNRTTRAWARSRRAAGAACPNWWWVCVLPVFAFAESNWSALFFFFAVSGLVSIGAMGAIAPPRRAPADHAGRVSGASGQFRWLTTAVKDCSALIL